MIDLEKVSGLPIGLNSDNTLKFNMPLKHVEPNIRTYNDVKSVLMDPEAEPPFREMYYMYRNVHFTEHEQVLKKAGVGYDITVIPAGEIGEEFNKTVGHYHATKAGTGIAFPEAYEVLHGKALFLLQKMDPTFQELITVIVMEANTGDKVVYPPNYGHIIVNIGEETLITSNYVADKFERMYKQVSDMKGMAYYVVADGTGYKLIENKNYKQHPKPRTLTNQFMSQFKIMDKEPMYSIGTNDPKSLEFLTDPEKYAVELSSITS
ncbi:MAG: hypothetical protein KW793_02890 [Candidatus Doudnabacteria bacterium]|nr:hypothetical protein [Candidatus Doudnabacteria bacterium]